MHLTENLNILAKSFQDIYKKIKNIEVLENSNKIRLETARNGMATIIYESEAGPVYLHSKYDPTTEAERFISQYKDVDRYKHVFFYGVGLGYHIEEFCKKWPDKRFTLYEPEQSILLNYLEERQLKKLPLENCKGIYTSSSQADIEYMLQKFVSQINGEVLFIVLPSYERVFGDSFKSFMEAFRITVANKRISLQVQTRFQKLWTTNSIKNFIEVINTSNILQDKKHYFAGKPAIIAAAGPSLEEELENLRLIRDKGLAYIFAAGSAINALLSNGVSPHAVCTYDPAPHNFVAMESFIKESDGSIPLIFGSSTFSDVLEHFSGKKYHVISDKDTIAQFYLKDETGEKPVAIMDSPSITIMLLQLLVKLECDPIILVGQNFAYRSDKYYAKGIVYDARPTEISEVEKNNAVTVKDVHGGNVYTNNTFNHMRRQMEEYIRYFNITNVINCTGGGARIEGTIYKPLKELVEGRISAPAAVEDWMVDQTSRYDLSYMSDQSDILLSEYNRLYTAIDRIIRVINELGSLSEEGSDKDIISALGSFEKELNELLKNKLFDTVLKPMNRVQMDIINRNLDDIRFERDVSAKARMIVEYFGDFVKDCKKDMKDITQIFYENNDYIHDNNIKVLSFTVQTV